MFSWLNPGCCALPLFCCAWRALMMVMMTCAIWSGFICFSTAGGWTGIVDGVGAAGFGWAAAALAIASAAARARWTRAVQPLPYFDQTGDCCMCAIRSSLIWFIKVETSALAVAAIVCRSEEHTSELQSRQYL